MTNTANGKDVIYVDVDDEITGIIDKVTSAQAKVVALVLPKRASVFQSIVNMKLLKKRADAAKKNLVLITSEAGLMPLAGSVGLYVASTLQSKPEIPPTLPVGGALANLDDEAAVQVPSEEFDPGKEGATPVGQLAGDAKPGVGQMPEETIELDNSDSPAGTADGAKGANVAALAANGGSGKAAKKGKNKKLKIPNFNKFRTRLILAALVLVLLIIGWIVANKILPKATIDISTNTSSVNANVPLTLDTNATSVDAKNGVVPAQTQQTQKTYTQQAPATGKKNEGSKATGSVTMTAEKCSGNPFVPPDDVPAGTGLSANGLTFITQQNTSFTGTGTNGSCFTYSATSSTSIKAQNGGSQYNVGGSTSFSVAGRSNVSASGSASGGTDNIITIVQQSDIDSAKQKLNASQNDGTIKQQLQQNLQNSGLYAVTSTYNTGKPSITSSANAGDQTENVTVTKNITYTMFGARKADLQKVIDASVDQQIDPNKQSIQADGLDHASFSVGNTSASKVQLTVQSTATIGPHLDIASLKPQIAGEKSGDVQSRIKANPGVTNVTVHYSPFWVTAVPKNVNKINIVFEKSSSGK